MGTPLLGTNPRSPVHQVPRRSRCWPHVAPYLRLSGTTPAQGKLQDLVFPTRPPSPRQTTAGGAGAFSWPQLFPLPGNGSACAPSPTFRPDAAREAGTGAVRPISGAAQVERSAGRSTQCPASSQLRPALPLGNGEAGGGDGSGFSEVPGGTCVFFENGDPGPWGVPFSGKRRSP